MRLHSLTSRFLFTLLLSTILPFLLFGWFALSGMRRLVDEQIVSVFLPQLAKDHAEKIDSRLQQIYQACSVVREMARHALESRAKLRDFREQVELVPDLLDRYVDLLLLADSDGEVVFWQEGQLLDRTNRAARLALIPDDVRREPWFQRAQAEGGVFWLAWGRFPYMHRGLHHVSKDPADYHVGLVIDVPTNRDRPGVLFALIRWPEVQRILDETRAILRDEAGFPSAEVFLVNPRGTIQAHTDRGEYGEILGPEELRSRILHAAGQGRAQFVDDSEEPRMAGFATLGQVENRRWFLGLHMLTDELFATSARFERALILAIAVTIAILVVWSLVASRAILRPVRRLVDATQRVARGDLEVRVPAAGSHELADLGRAFNSMAEDLTLGRERLKAAERQTAWAEMARQVAHEIKNPLTPMRMSAQLLQKARREGDARADDLADRLARIVLHQTQALDRIASDFRHFAGAPFREKEDVEADELLREVHGSYLAMSEAGELNLETEPGAPGVVVAVDREEMQRVFLNLLQNAVQAGAVQAGASLDPPPDRPSNGLHVRLSSARDGDRVVYRVEDNGPGIPIDIRQHLFEPYFTTKSSGTGLGLAICKRIVEAHGGTICLESSKAGRTVFRLDLPLSDSAEP